MLASLTFGAIMVAAVPIASVIVFPSVQPATIISSLGIRSVAIGFAFKEILQNILAGILLNRPFRRGNQIVEKDFEGTVEHIESRATLIKTYDGLRVIIPNSDIYTSPVIVNTAFPTRRDQFDIGIGYGDNPDAAMRIFSEAIAPVEVWRQTLRRRFCPGGSLQARSRYGHAGGPNLRASTLCICASRVILAIWQAAADNGIDLPFPTQQILFHNQTEDSDGDRRRQPEGWPIKDNGSASASAPND